MSGPTACHHRAMIYTTLLARTFRLLYGEPAEVEPGPGSGLVLVADGVGGLDLCGTALKYVMGARGGPHVVRLHRLGPRLRPMASRPDQRRQPPGPGRGRWPTRSSPGTAGGRGRRCSSWASRAARASSSGRWRGCRPDTVEAAVLLAPALSPGYDLHAGAGGGPPRDGRLLVAAGRLRPGPGDAGLRHDRPGPHRSARGWSGSRGGAGASSGRSAGGRRWRRRGTSAGTSGRIVRPFCGSTSCRS